MISRSYGTNSYGTAQRGGYGQNPAAGQIPQSYANQQPFYDPEVPRKPEGAKVPKILLTRHMVIVIGVTVLACLLSIPASDSVVLWRDFNFVFWNGQEMPIITLISCVLLFLSYTWFSRSIGTENLNDEYRNFTLHYVSQLVQTFITLVGVLLVLASLCLYYREQKIVDALLYNCKSSYITHDLRATYSVLRELRRTTECATMWSVEQCRGYDEIGDPEMKAYLKELESNYYCAGFCDTDHVELVQKITIIKQIKYITLHKKTHGGLNHVLWWKKWMALHRHGIMPHLPHLKALEVGEDVKPALPPDPLGLNATGPGIVHEPYLPPALFSQGVYKTSCEGSAARHLKFHALNIAEGWFWIAIAVIAVSAVVGFAEYIYGGK